MSSATTPSTITNPWTESCEHLQCVDCGARLEPAESALVCSGCQRSYPVADGILQMMHDLSGYNKVAADFYNSSLWPRFRFWEWFTFTLNGGERRARRQVLKHLPDLAGKRMLEVAIGDGANVPYLPADCEVWGADISTVQLQQCRRRNSDRNLHLVLGEAEKLPFKDHTFDHVLSVGAFNYFNDRPASLREMTRVVKPDGLVVVADEYPTLPNRMIGYWIGLPQIDRWIMSKFMHLGDDFTKVVEENRHLQLEPIAKEALDDCQIHSIWGWGVGYCIVGRPKATRGEMTKAE